MSVRFYLVQETLDWERPETNLRRFEDRIAGLFTGVTEAQANPVVVLPEMFSTGFSMASAKLAEPMDGPTVAWMKRLSGEHGIHLCGSAIIEDGGKFHNRFLWADGDSVTWYDKRHLFRMADEHSHYAAGTRRVMVEAGELKVLPQVCYDLRFPAWSRNANEYDTLLYVANWPAARADQWLALLRARAIENQCYTIGVNRVGTDGNKVAYQGDTVVFDYLGKPVLTLGNEAGVGEITIDPTEMRKHRMSFPAHLDADRFHILS